MFLKEKDRRLFCEIIGFIFSMSREFVFIRFEREGFVVVLSGGEFFVFTERRYYRDSR